MDSRREFLKKLVAVGFMAPLAGSGVLSATSSRAKGEEYPDFFYKYKTVSVEHLSELRTWIDELDRAGKLSRNETYRSYIDTKTCTLPDDFKDAKSVIVMATSGRLLYADFHLDGKVHETMIPPGYYDDGLSADNIMHTITTRIVKEPGHRVDRAKGIFLKQLAVRSGLAEYGRNNISYVDGMGSFLTLRAYLTDHSFTNDDWHELRMMNRCRKCRICMHGCPNGCIREENFVIDAGRCLTLYNEVDGTFPQWILPDAHNSLVGCMKCQLPCPANREVVKMAGRLEDVTEEETRKILDGKPDEELIKSLNGKLRGFDLASVETFPTFTRNLKVLVQ
jgi:epoxyqueuosine reductase